MKNERSPLWQLVKRLLKSLRRTFARKPEPPGTLETATDWADLYRAESADPGVVACWWICHRYAKHDLSITLLNLARLREEHRRVADLTNYLEAAGGLDSGFISHILVVTLRAPSYHSQRRAGEAAGDRAITIRPIGVWPCDLQGFSSAWSAGDRYAVRIAEIIARNALKLKSEPGRTWEAVMIETDWLGWLEVCAQRAFGPTHTLQPRKPSRESRPRLP